MILKWPNKFQLHFFHLELLLMDLTRVDQIYYICDKSLKMSYQIHKTWKFLIIFESVRIDEWLSLPAHPLGPPLDPGPWGMGFMKI